MREIAVDKAATDATGEHDRERAPMWSPVSQYAVVKLRAAR